MISVGLAGWQSSLSSVLSPPCPSASLLSPSLLTPLLEVAPINPAMVSGECCEVALPQQAPGRAGRQTVFGTLVQV